MKDDRLGRKAGTCFLTGSPFLLKVTQAESQSVGSTAGQREN